MKNQNTVTQNAKKSKRAKAEEAKLLDYKPSFGERILNFPKTYWYLLIAMAIPAIIFFLIYLARGLYPFGDGTVLVLDLNGQYVYFFEALRNTVLEGGSLLYSWSRALGGEFLGMYAYYVASPLSYLIVLFPKDRTQEFLLLLFMLKSAICAGTMGFYLHQHSVNKNKISVILFSVMYALSAYCVVQQSNTMWIDAGMWLPLVILGVENVVKYGKYKLYVFFLALTLASNFYIGYMVCIFVLLYFFFYMIAYKEDYVNNPRYEKLHFLKSFVRMGVFSLLAIGIAAVIIFSAYYSLQFGKNEFTDPSWEIKMKFDFYDLLFKLLPSSYDTVRIDGLPFVYCGVLTLILAPLFFCSKKFTIREKVASGVFLLVIALSFMISVTDLIWHGFQKPQWLNARFSFMFCFLLLFIAFRAFDRINEMRPRALAVVSAFIFSYVVLLQNFADDFKDKLVALSYGPNADDFTVHPFATILLTIVCLIVYVSLIAIMRKAKNKDLIAAILLAVVCGELFLSGLTNVNDFDKDVGFTTYQSYNEFNNLMRPIVDTLTDEYDTSFYRFEKTYHRKLNDNMALSIRGVSNSTSTLNADTIEFLKMLGYYSQSHKSQYKGGTLVTDSLLGMKYIISNRDYTPLYGEPVLSGIDYANHEGMTLEELMDATFADKYNDYTANDFYVYENIFALSLAFAASDNVLDVNMKNHNTYISETHKDYAEKYNPDGYTSPFTRVNALLSGILGEKVEVFKPAKQNGEPTLTNCTYRVSPTGHDLYEIKDDKKEGKITYSYTVPEGHMLYLFFPAYYNRQIILSSETMKIFDSTRSDGTINHGKSSSVSYAKCDDRIVELGYAPGNQYKLTVTIDNSYDEFYTKPDDSFIYYVDMAEFKRVFSRIQENQLVYSDFYTEDNIGGTIKTNNDDQLIMTTIPYDAGWRVIVDGRLVETFEVADALIGFRIDEAGEHNVRFVYLSTPFIAGLLISILAAFLFIILIIVDRFLKKLPFAKYFYPAEITRPVKKSVNQLQDNNEVDQN